MSINSGTFEQPSPASKATPNITPMRIMLSLVVLIFISEMIAMAIIFLLAPPNYLIGTLIDGLIMIFLILPALYYLQLAPLETGQRANSSRGSIQS